MRWKRTSHWYLPPPCASAALAEPIDQWPMMNCTPFICRLKYCVPSCKVDDWPPYEYMTANINIYFYIRARLFDAPNITHRFDRSIVRIRIWFVGAVWPVLAPFVNVRTWIWVINMRQLVPHVRINVTLTNLVMSFGHPKTAHSLDHILFESTIYISHLEFNYGNVK